MSELMNASRAYAANAASRDPRAQEADVFRRATAALRQSKGGSDIARVRALADNDRLWNTVTSVAPDFDFLVQVNEDIVAGLSGAAA